MKKLVLAIALAAVSTGAFAHGHRGGWHGGYHHGWHGGYHHHGWHGGYHHGWHGCYHHCHGGYWGPGGRYFWPGFVGGVVGGVVGTALASPYYSETVVVQQPVVQRQPVWVEGRYVDQVQANGSTVRVWQPGHYE